MYAQHYGLAEAPFANPFELYWFYQSPAHEEAVARLMYLVEQNRRCGVLSGLGGTGKSFVLQVLLAEARRLPREAVMIDLLGRSGRDLLWETLASLGLGARIDESPRVQWRMLTDHLAANRYTGASTVICFDHLDRAEADCLTALERLYHVAATESGVTLVLSVRDGRSPRLIQTLASIADLNVELAPLDREQTELYVETLLARAGGTQTLFDSEAYDRIYAETRGVPRDISRLCDLALVAGMADDAPLITEAIVAATAEQLHPLRNKPPIFRSRRALAEI